MKRQFGSTTTALDVMCSTIEFKETQMNVSSNGGRLSFRGSGVSMK